MLVRLMDTTSLPNECEAPVISNIQVVSFYPNFKNDCNTPMITNLTYAMYAIKLT